MPMYMYLGFHTWGEPPLDPLKSRRVARPAAGGFTGGLIMGGLGQGHGAL